MLAVSDLREARRQREQLSRAFTETNQGVVLLDAKWRAAWMTPLAREWLKIYFPDWCVNHTSLPKALHQWLSRPCSDRRAPGASEPLVIAHHAGQLSVRRVAQGKGRFCLLLTQASANRVPKPLATLDLTTRESETLHWMVEGKTNPEIGVILQISRNTVRKHVEHILKKLGVENRGAAARRIWELESSATKNSRTVGR